MATRELIGGARADHGAQFFTARSNAFGETIARWVAEEVAWEWCRGFGADDGHPRYAAINGMAALARHVALGLDVRTSVKVDSVRRRGSGWVVGWSGGHGTLPGSLEADAVLLTAPVPQSSALVGDHLDLPDLTYTPTISLMVALAGRSGVPAPGGVQVDSDPTWSWIGDNQAKGTSSSPAVTLHTRPDVALARWDDDRETLTSDLLMAASPWLGPVEVLAASLHRWRYATPVDPHPDRCLASDDGHLVIAGDAFGGPRVEGAFLSGLAAAEAIVEA